MPSNLRNSAVLEVSETGASWRLRCCGRSTNGTAARHLAALAAAFAFYLARNRAFIDGNQRIAFLAMMVFLRSNGIPFQPDPAHATEIFLCLSTGEVSEQSLTRWIRDNWPSS